MAKENVLYLEKLKDENEILREENVKLKITIMQLSQQINSTLSMTNLT